jgi:hypothetical protein
VVCHKERGTFALTRLSVSQGLSNGSGGTLVTLIVSCPNSTGINYDLLAPNPGLHRFGDWGAVTSVVG